MRDHLELHARRIALIENLGDELEALDLVLATPRAIKPDSGSTQPILTVSPFHANAALDNNKAPMRSTRSSHSLHDITISNFN